MQRQPLLGLFDAVIMKFVVYRARAQRFEKIRADFFRKLACVNGDVDER